MAVEPCDNYIRNIEPAECLNTSLSKINNNFLDLEEVVCGLKQRMDKVKPIRTFFYYGPNAETNASSNMADNQVSRPSDLTIRAFVNSPTQLNLTAISRKGDVAYVIYQKTGFLNNQLANISTNYEFGNVPDPKDVFNSFAPIFVIWRLTYAGDPSGYIVDTGFPKFSQANTSADGTGNTWNQPQEWTTF